MKIKMFSDDRYGGYRGYRGVYKQLLLIMKLAFFILMATFLHVSADVRAQKVTIDVSKAPLEEVLSDLRKQTGYDVFYNSRMIKNAAPVTLSVKGTDLEKALDRIFANQLFTYTIESNSIVVKERPGDASGPLRIVLQQDRRLVGRVTNQAGQALEGVSVFFPGRPAVRTDEQGRYVLVLISTVGSTDSISFSHVGYVRRTLPIPTGNTLDVIMTEAIEDIGEVIVTGMMERRRENFTGAVASFSGEELKTVNNQNLIQSLRSLDPSFIQIENNLAGSNPNVLPTIELRGQTSITTESLRDEFSADPNQPLFILDGFPTTLREIVDLDMNIVASVHILKDAASTAIYGSRASNGVVVVETIKPKAGKVTFRYTTDLNTQLADLTSYNMMDAREKLEFERLSGRYLANSGIHSVQLTLDSIYARRLAEVERGVNTYWLSQPLQTGYSHRHSISARGGEGAVVFDLGANYRTTKGAMIGNQRDDWGANLNINYRTGKVNISNRAFVTGSSSQESPYGNFSTWVNTNPYYRLLDHKEKYLDVAQSLTAGYSILVSNPLYNASLNSYDGTKDLIISNNLQINVDFNPWLRLQTGGQIRRQVADATVFVSPLDTRFDNSQNQEKGSLDNTKTDVFSYTVNAMLTYARVFADKHRLTSNLRTEINENDNSLRGYTAIGFPSAATGNPRFSYGYPEGGRPQASNTVFRRNSVMASVNYSFHQRYNVDLSFNLDGSTAFGSNRRYSPYYAAGLGWNLHNEAFFQHIGWISLLRLRGNIGVTGNQNFGNVSQSVYNYTSRINRFGQGVILSALGAPDLEWQRTRETSLGMDVAFFRNRFNFEFNVYEKYTDPLVVAVTLPASTGLSNYPFNAGALTVQGMDVVLNYSPIYRPQDRVVWTLGLTGTMLDLRYSKFDNQLNSLNNELRESNALTRYRDGYSSRHIWAVPSLGIDPATGREVFLAKDGQQTFFYNTDNQVVVGNSQPLAEGVLRSSVSYKGFTASLIFRYILDKDVLNTALYNKVENISMANVENNQDRRALYDRWQQPGDKAQFKSISITATTPISSRFVQRENTLTGESINLGYEFRNAVWLDRALLSSLRVNAYMNDIFYASTIRRERGVNFPFARSVSMSLSATFK